MNLETVFVCTGHEVHRPIRAGQFGIAGQDVGNDDRVQVAYMGDYRQTLSMRRRAQIDHSMKRMGQMVMVMIMVIIVAFKRFRAPMRGQVRHLTLANIGG